MTRREADSRYVYYLQNNLNRLKKKESVIKSNFQEVGVYDLDKIKLITSIIFLNMAPLQETEFGNLLFFKSKQMLHEIK